MRGKKTLWMLTCLTLPAAFAAPVLAQTEGGQSSGGSVSFFQMFFLPGAGTPSGLDIIGTSIVWFLLLMSAVSMGFMISLAIKNRRVTLVPFEVYTQIEEMLNNKQYREAIEFTSTDESYLAKLVGAALAEASNGYTSMERAIEEVGDAETTRTLRPIEYLNVIGNIAPMLGLFGTVYGMIRAFQTLVELGGKPNPADLAAGISTALVTTFWGLVVAMPALAGYALIRNRVDALTAEGMLMAEELIRPFKPGGKKSGSTSGAGSAARKPSGSSAGPAKGGTPTPAAAKA
jgi:biopolymer transport protein ExbB